MVQYYYYDNVGLGYYDPSYLALALVLEQVRESLEQALVLQNRAMIKKV